MNQENKASCLCGQVAWSLQAEPFALYNCHCRMCQKIHGAAFGTYAYIRDEEFQWTGSTDTIVNYQSSKQLTRSSCSVCGSVVPFQCQGHKGSNKNGDRYAQNTEHDYWVAPAGSHDAMRKPDFNIFIADNAPWHQISGNLPTCDTYPQESITQAVEMLPPVTNPDGHIGGSCLCGNITYEVTEPIKLARNCHCSRCRKGRSSAHASNGFASYEGVRFLSGEENLREYKVPEAQFFTQVFCKDCSSLLPRRDAGRGISVIPMGSLDDDPGLRTSDHIFVEHKASWHDITDDLKQYPQGPPPG